MIKFNEETTLLDVENHLNLNSQYFENREDFDTLDWSSYPNKEYVYVGEKWGKLESRNVR